MELFTPAFWRLLPVFIPRLLATTKMADTWESVKTVLKKLSLDQLCENLFFFFFFEGMDG